MGNTDPGRAFVALALRLDRVQPGLVDSWWGPPEIAAKVAAEPVLDPRRLADDAAVLLQALPGHDLEPPRRRSLAGRTAALRSLALRLSGERRSWTDDVEAAFSVRPQLGDPARYERAHAHLADVLPGPAPLIQRYRAYRAAMTCPPHRVPDALTALAAALRTATATITELPSDDHVDWRLTTEAPWAASARHLGGGRSEVTLEAGAPLRLAQLPGLVAHEAYPGHHTQGLRADATRVAKGWVEHAVTLVATPDCLIAEGRAELALSVVDDGTLASGVYAAMGIAYDGGLAAAAGAAVSPLENVRQDAAIMLHELGRPEPEVRDYLATWGLMTQARVDATMAFLTHPLWRYYVATYAEGGRLVAAWLDARPAGVSVAQQYVRLLDEPLLPGDLAGELAGSLLRGVHPSVGRVAEASEGSSA